MRVSVEWIGENPKAEQVIVRVMEESWFFKQNAYPIKLEPVSYSGIGTQVDLPGSTWRSAYAHRERVAFECGALKLDISSDPRMNGLLVMNAITRSLWENFQVHGERLVDGLDLGTYAAILEERESPVETERSRRLKDAIGSLGKK